MKVADDLGILGVVVLEQTAFSHKHIVVFAGCVIRPADISKVLNEFLQTLMHHGCLGYSGGPTFGDDDATLF